MGRESSSGLTDAGAGVLGVVAAYRREVAPLLRRAQHVRRLGRGRYGLRIGGGEVVVVIGGVGKRNSAAAAEALAAAMPLKGLVSWGFASGLEEGVVPGEVVVAEEVIEQATGDRFECGLQLLSAEGPRRGAILAVDEVIRDAGDKQRLGRKFNAVAADMESAGVARSAVKFGLPVAAIRAITDGGAESLWIDFESCRGDDGELLSSKVFLRGISSPRGVQDLWRLAGSSRLAARRLAESVRP